jgi:bacterioferritin-associated ferredoxin
MYICICNQVKDSQITALVESGVSSLDQIQAQTGLGSVCGKCLFRARRLLNESKENRDSEQQVELHYEVG